MDKLYFLKRDYANDIPNHIEGFITQYHRDILLDIEIIEEPNDTNWIYEVRPTQGNPMIRIEATIPDDILTELQGGRGNILLDNAWEGQANEIFNTVHVFLTEQKIPNTQCIYVTSGQGAQEQYDIFCRKHNITRKIVILQANSFEGAYCTLTNNKCVTAENKPYKFICLNRMLKPHRVVMVSLLEYHNLLKDGLVSMFNNDGVSTVGINKVYDFSDQENTNVLSVPAQEGIKTLINRLPLTIDFTEEQNEQVPMSVPRFEELYNKAYYNIVTESSFHPAHIPFFTEKTYRSVFEKQPFIHVGPHKSLAAFRSLGYKTFDPYIDESYDNEPDGYKRLDLIIDEIERLNKMNKLEFGEWLVSMSGILEHNYSRLKDPVQSFHLTTLHKIREYAS